MIKRDGKQTCAGGKYCFEDFGDTKIQNNYVRVLMARLINKDLKEDLKKDLIHINETIYDDDGNVKTPSNIHNTVDDMILQGFAVPCPGCQINYYNFLLNNRDYWNNSFCTDIVKEEGLSLTAEEKLQKTDQRTAAGLEAQAAGLEAEAAALRAEADSLRTSGDSLRTHIARPPL